MAKDKKSKLKIPKEIAGVRIPKELRKTGNALLERAASPVGRDLIAAGLAMAATAAAAAAHEAREKQPPAPAPQPAARPAAESGASTGVPDAQMIGETLGKAAEAMLDRVFGARRA